jgi:cytosine/adenosine deaminase-related metal-dependent hydrolase
MDRNSPDHYIETTEDSLKATKSFISHFDTLPSPPSGQTPLVQPIINPRFALSCTGSLLHSLGELANSRTPSIAIQTHLSENTKEIASTLQEFPDCEMYTEVYDKAGLVGEGTILAHCIHLDRKEMEILRDRKAGVSHCPVSNMNLNSGVAEVRKLLDMQIKVCCISFRTSRPVLMVGRTGNRLLRWLCHGHPADSPTRVHSVPIQVLSRLVCVPTLSTRAVLPCDFRWSIAL